MELVRAGTDTELAMLSLAIVCVRVCYRGVVYYPAAAEVIGSRRRRGVASAVGVGRR